MIRYSNLRISNYNQIKSSDMYLLIIDSLHCVDILSLFSYWGVDPEVAIQVFMFLLMLAMGTPTFRNQTNRSHPTLSILVSIHAKNY